MYTLPPLSKFLASLTSSLDLPLMSTGPKLLTVKAVRVLRTYYEDSGEDAFLMQYRFAVDTGEEIEESVNRIAQYEEN